MGPHQGQGKAWVEHKCYIKPGGIFEPPVPCACKSREDGWSGTLRAKSSDTPARWITLVVDHGSILSMVEN
ncbi:hypothetical protein KAR91_65870 [Candidatus Pacearchaeota archaeon]|nr:hypothetical protein [Candidatus Pacearchaeota archaeon]